MQRYIYNYNENRGTQNLMFFFSIYFIRLKKLLAHETLHEASSDAPAEADEDSGPKACYPQQWELIDRCETIFKKDNAQHF